MQTNLPLEENLQLIATQLTPLFGLEVLRGLAALQALLVGLGHPLEIEHSQEVSVDAVEDGPRVEVAAGPPAHIEAGALLGMGLVLVAKENEKDLNVVKSEIE